MLVEVKVPQLSESVAEATLLSWHQEVGDAVVRDEKPHRCRDRQGGAELPAPAGGVITRIVKADGGTVVSGEVIAMIDTAADSAAAVAKAAERPALRWHKRHTSGFGAEQSDARGAQDGRGAQARSQSIAAAAATAA